MRRSLAIVLAAWCGLAAADARAGRLFGDIQFEGKPLPAGAVVTVAAASDSASTPVFADSTTTDRYGSYKLQIKHEGRCVLTIVHAGQAVSLEVFSYRNPTRYDLALARQDGRLVLRRR